jgi:hypothetical protein
MNLTTLAQRQLRQAADLTDRIEALREQLSAVLEGGETPAPVSTEARPAPKTETWKRRRKLSAEGRARLSAAATARWAAWRLRRKGVASVQASAAPPAAGKKLHWT